MADIWQMLDTAENMRELSAIEPRDTQLLYLVGGQPTSAWFVVAVPELQPSWFLSINGNPSKDRAGG